MSAEIIMFVPKNARVKSIDEQLPGYNSLLEMNKPPVTAAAFQALSECVEAAGYEEATDLKGYKLDEGDYIIGEALRLPAPPDPSLEEYERSAGYPLDDGTPIKAS